MNTYINETLRFLGIYLIICFLWITLEKIILGSCDPNIVDDIIAVILTFSLEANLNSWNNKYKNKQLNNKER